MLDHFLTLQFETNILRMSPILSRTIHTLAELPMVSFTLTDGDGNSSRAYYDVEILVDPDKFVAAHHCHSMANRFIEAMRKENVRFDAEEFRWHGSPEEYLASALRGSMNRKYPDGTSVIRENGVTVKLPQGAMLQIYSVDDSRLDDTNLNNRDFLLHTLMIGKLMFFGVEKIWLIYHPHSEFTEISIPDALAFRAEAEEALWKAFPFLRGHVVFGPEISKIVKAEVKAKHGTE